MFGHYHIGYAQNVEPDVEDPLGASAGDDLRGWRSWFAHHGRPPAAREHGQRVPAGPPRSLRSSPLRSSPPRLNRPLISPRLRADPRLRVWIMRAAISLAILIGFSVWQSWRIGLTVAIIYACADTIYRSRTTGVVPAGVRVTSAQRSTAHRLRLLQPAGYLALTACTIPGTTSIIDHLVVGPAGIFAIDSERIDRRLPLRAIGGVLYHGPRSLEARLEHARFEARKAAAFIGAELGRTVRVQPVMVIYGPAIPWVVMRLQGVDVYDGRHVGTYFRRQSKATAANRISHQQVADVLAAARRALPPIRLADSAR
jgi:hypothetical protein